MNAKRMQDIEGRSRELFQESVEGLDMRLRSRLTQARHAALAAAGAGSRPRWMSFTPAFGAAAALVMAVGLWVGHGAQERGSLPDARNGLEDLELVASNDPLEFLQDDPEFYDWVQKSDAAVAPGGSTG